MPDEEKSVHLGATGLQPPSPFVFTSPGEWTTWIQTYEDYAFATGLRSASDETQVRTLLYCMGPQARTVLASLGVPAPETQPFAAVKERLTQHFVHPANEIYESRRFHRRTQQPGETVDAFFTELRTLIRRCNYNSPEIEDRLVRDKFVVGLLDEKLSDQLCRSTRLTADEALLQARQHEDAERERASRSAQAAAALNVDATKKRTPSSAPSSRARNRQQRLDNAVCGNCGRSAHDRKDCPARKATCNFCKKQGHFAEVCRAKKRKEKLGSVELCSVRTQRARYVEVSVNGHVTRFKVDSGADVTVVPPSLPGVPRKLDAVEGELIGPGNQPLPVLGTFQATLAWKDKRTVQQLYVMRAQTTPLLGLPAIEALGVVKFVNTTSAESGKTDGRVPSSDARVSCVPSSDAHIFKGLGELQEKYTIRLKSGAQPYSLSVPRRIPLPLFDVVKRELDAMEAQGVIRRVDKPTAWCSGLVVVPKSSGGYRLCVDLTKLNQVIERERYVLPTVNQILGQLGEAKVFSKLDATSSFHQIKLSDASEELTTFITPFGRYCYRRLPFGLASAPEYFQRQMSRVLEGLPGVVNMIDDVLVYGRDLEQHDQRLAEVLRRLEQAGVKLNDQKCEFRVPSVKFLGVVVDGDGISPDPDKLRAIRELPPPTDVAGVRRLLGMVNHIGRFLPHLSDVTAPIRSLLNKSSAWSWGASQDDAFKRLKAMLSSETCMAKYHPRYPTILSADASSFGLGAVLLQDQPSGARRAVAFASRSLTPTEARYSQTEKEALAVTWAVLRFDQYLRGLSFTVESDHLPLVALLGKKELDLLPPRIQRMRIKLMRYQFDVRHVPGRLLATADTLSRAPCDVRSSSTVFSVEIFASEIFKGLPPPLANRLEEVRRRQAEDGECSLVVRYCQEGWPDKRKLPPNLVPYWKERGRLTVSEDLLLLDCRLVIPAALRSNVLALLHDGHQGLRRCKERARESVWWPNCNSHIEHLVTSCDKCAETRVVHSEPLMSTPTPDRPWQRLAIDLFQLKGRDYVLMVDYYSRFPEVVSLSSTSASAVIAAIKSCFSRHGIPDVVRTDNGPQFASQEFANFALSYGFEHETSSPRYPQSNGAVERMVRTVKDLLYKSEDPYLALLTYRDTPGVAGVSPAMLLMGRRLQTRLPALPQRLAPVQPSHERFRAQDSRNKVRQARDFNRRHNARSLNPLKPGDSVWVTDASCQARVLSPAQRPRSYVVETPKGILQRNRRHLVPFSPTVTARESVELPAAEEPPGQPPEEGQPGELPTAGCSSPSLDRASSPQGVTRSRYGRAIKPPRRLDL